MRDNGRYKDSNPLIFCDTPIDQQGLVVHDELVLTGWAVSAAGIAGVEVRIDDERRLQASYGLDSPWVAETVPEMPDAEFAGYELRLDTSKWQAGARRVAITATDHRGRQSEIRGGVEVVPFRQPHYTVEDNLAAIADGEPVMWLDEPRLTGHLPELSGALEVAGWAYAPQGIESVTVTVDRSTRLEALRPVSRGDLLTDYGPEIAGEAGFFLSLDSSEIPPGTHTISVVAVARDGRAVGVEGEVLRSAERGSPPPTSGPEAVEWLAERRTPRLRQLGDGSGASVAERQAKRLVEAERTLRRRWAEALAQGGEVLDVASEQDPHDLRFDDASFDLVTCFDLIQRAPDPDGLIEEMRRVLRPEGVLLISVARPRVGPDDDRRARELSPGELERSLRDRFQNVAVHHQRTWISSTLLDENGLGDADGGSDLGLDMRRTAAVRPGEETHAIAIAGDGPLPAPPRIGILASSQPLREALASALMWEDRARLAEADAAASRAQVNLAQMHQKGAAGKLRDAEARALEAEALQASLSWRITRPLRSLKRRLGSRRAAQ